MHSSDGQPSVRRFALAASSVLLFSLCAMAALNWLESPFAFFAPPRWHRVNDQQSSAFRSADRARQIGWLERQRQQPNTSSVLIGTSQVLYGMDTCPDPHMQRVALYDLNSDEISRFLESAGPTFHAPLTLYIQQNLVTRTGVVAPLRAGWRPFLQNLLDQQTTEVSLANLSTSVAAKQPACAAVPYEFAPGPSALAPAHVREELLEQQKDLADRHAVADLLTNLTPTCRRLHATVILFTLPTYFNQEVRPNLLSHFQANARTVQKAIAALAIAHSGCTVRFLDLATAYLQTNPNGVPQSDWFDLNHFVPAVGKRFLDQIAGAAR